MEAHRQPSLGDMVNERLGNFFFGIEGVNIPFEPG